jgi:putative sigma-54 modulation protein
MQVHITARHLPLTPALANYVQKKLDRIERHFRAVLRVQAILSVEKHRHIAEIVVHANNHHDFRAKGESADLYAAVDLVAEKLHKHMARQKDKRVRGRRRAPAPLPAEPLPLVEPETGETLGPPVTRVSRFTPRVLTVAEAAQEMELAGYSFLLFINDDAVNVLYKRKDNTYGLLEPNLS